MTHNTFLVELRILDAPTPEMNDWKTVLDITEEIDSGTVKTDCETLAAQMKLAVQDYLTRVSSDTIPAGEPMSVAHPMT